jgi:hypothetical protein
MHSGTAPARESSKLKVWVSGGASKQLTDLKPVLEKLKLVHRRFIDSGEDDCTYWYHERSHIGFLAAAVWLSGGIALEEYGDKKIGGREKGCRNDLWLKVGTTEICCEAKYISLRLKEGEENLKKSALKIGQALDRARQNVRELKGQEGLALCFSTIISPKSTRSASSSESNTQIQQLFEQLKRGCQALVWLGEGQKIGNDGRSYMGVLLTIDEVS